jgi:hypothetical protein
MVKMNLTSHAVRLLRGNHSHTQVFDGRRGRLRPGGRVLMQSHTRLSLASALTTSIMSPQSQSATATSMQPTQGAHQHSLMGAGR